MTRTEILKAIEKLEISLDNMRSIHRSLYNEYGSELCAEDMLKQEEKIQGEIKELKEKYDRAKV